MQSIIIAYLEAEMFAVNIIPDLCVLLFSPLSTIFYGRTFAYSGPDCLLLTRCFLGFGKKKCWTFPWGTVCVYSCGCFLKCWYPTTITIGFPTKHEHFGVFWGYHHLRKHLCLRCILQSFDMLWPLEDTVRESQTRCFCEAQRNTIYICRQKS